MKRFLVCSSDVSVVDRQPIVVHANSPMESITRYLREVYSKDPVFRESVLDLCVNMSFLEQFYIPSQLEQERFLRTGTVGTEEEIVKSRLRAFFDSRPDLGEKYISYMETGDETLIDDEMFEYIAEHETADKAGVTVVDIELLQELV